MSQNWAQSKWRVTCCFLLFHRVEIQEMTLLKGFIYQCRGKTVKCTKKNLAASKTKCMKTDINASGCIHERIKQIYHELLIWHIVLIYSKLGQNLKLKRSQNIQQNNWTKLNETCYFFCIKASAVGIHLNQFPKYIFFKSLCWVVVLTNCLKHSSSFTEATDLCHIIAAFGITFKF